MGSPKEGVGKILLDETQTRIWQEKEFKVRKRKKEDSEHLSLQETDKRGVGWNY